MQKRFLVVALAVLGLLVLVSFWQAGEPPVRVKPLKPSELPLDGEPQAGTRPLEARLQDKPLDSSITELPRELPPPPPAPVVENDPTKGRIWLRLIDARSNRPMADKQVELLPAGYTGAGTEYGYLLDSPRPASRATNSDGLIGLSVVSQDEISEKPADVILNKDMEEAVLLHVPVPHGWYPMVDVYDLGREIHRLGTKPAAIPIDVFVMQLASTLRIVVRDEWGVPLPDARLDYLTLYTGSAADEWLSMAEDPPGCTEESEWTDWAEYRRRECTWEGVATSFELSGRQGPSIVYPADEEPAYGSVLLRNLPCVKVGAIGWHPVYGFGSATLELVPGSNELNVYLHPEGGATLNVRIEWVGELPGGDNGATLELDSSGPCGLNERLEDDDYEFYWELANSTTGVWTGTIRNVPAGWWTLHCNFPGNGDGSTERFQVSPYETRGITLYGGEDIYARWKPIIRCGGVQLERASLYLLGGWDREPDQYSVDHDPETGETDPLLLIPGNYTVWIPTLPPFEITIKPNEERSDVYELAINTVRVTIDAQLAALLSPENDPITLNLLPDDAWDGAEEHLYAMDAAMRQRDENYDQLLPGVTRTWLIPAGRYRWELLGTDEELHGPVEFNRAGPTRLDFALNALPGLALLQLEFEGFNDEQPAVDFDDDGLQETAIYAFRAGDEEFSRDYGGYLEEDRYVQQIWAAERMLYAFAPRGRRLASIYAGPESADVHVDFPGRATITPTQMVRPGEGLMHLRDAGDEEAEVYDPDNYHVMAYHERGECGEYTAGDVLDMELGRVTLMVTRGSDIGYSFASVTVTLTREEQELRLDKLDYKPFGRVTLTFSGRGSPDSPFDAWWYGENAPRPPVVLALDQVVSGTPRYVHLGSPDQLLPQGRLEFVYRDRQLPPGRYKVIPWPGAEEKWQVTFEITAGTGTQAVIQGGK